MSSFAWQSDKAIFFYFTQNSVSEIQFWHGYGGSDGKASVYNVGDWGSIPGLEDPLEKEMAIHSSTIAWKIPWTEEPGRYSLWGRKELDTTEQLHFHFLEM